MDTPPALSRPDDPLAPAPAPSGGGALIGYARVSTHDHKLDRQLAALQADGCVRVLADTASARDAHRPNSPPAWTSYASPWVGSPAPWPT